MYESQLVQSFAGLHGARIFDYVRPLSTKSSIPATVFINDLSATSDTEKAELFNSLRAVSLNIGLHATIVYAESLIIAERLSARLLIVQCSDRI